MALNDVAGDLRRVAGGQIRGHAEGHFYCLQVGSLDDRGDETVAAQMLDPTGATPTIWIFRKP